MAFQKRASYFEMTQNFAKAFGCLDPNKGNDWEGFFEITNMTSLGGKQVWLKNHPFFPRVFGGPKIDGSTMFNTVSSICIDVDSFVDDSYLFITSSNIGWFICIIDILVDERNLVPICSMYGIFTYIYHKYYMPNCCFVGFIPGKARSSVGHTSSNFQFDESISFFTRICCETTGTRPESTWRFRILSKWIVTRVITPISGLYAPKS